MPRYQRNEPASNPLLQRVPCYNAHKKSPSGTRPAELSLSESPIAEELLEFDASTSFFDFTFDLLGLFFGDSLFEGCGNPFDHLLGFH